MSPRGEASGGAQGASRAENLRASGWILADLGLNIWALTIVKLMGADYPAVQLVFLRAAMGLVVLTPWVWVERGAFARIDRKGLHLLRVVLSTVTLATSFFAISRITFALFTAINFTRPVILMLMAAAILGERIGRMRWIGAGAGLAGAVIAVGPGLVAPSVGLLALCVTVVTGTGAVIVTRALKGTPAVVMMAVYAGGLTLATGPVAVWTWVPVAPDDWPILLAVGIFAQGAQLCFLRAHWLGDAGVIGPMGYLSLLLSVSVGYLVFGEVPSAQMILGAAIIVVSALWLARSA